jgi:hypothetical protein
MTRGSSTLCERLTCGDRGPAGSRDIRGLGHGGRDRVSRHPLRRPERARSPHPVTRGHPPRRTATYVVLLVSGRSQGDLLNHRGRATRRPHPVARGRQTGRTAPYVVLLGFETVAGRPPQPPGCAARRPHPVGPGQPVAAWRRTSTRGVSRRSRSDLLNHRGARVPQPGHQARRTAPYVVLLGFETVAERPPQPPGARDRQPGHQARRTATYVDTRGFETVAERPPQPPRARDRQPGHQARRTATYVDTRGFETVAERPPQPPGGRVLGWAG